MVILNKCYLHIYVSDTKQPRGENSFVCRVRTRSNFFFNYKCLGLHEIIKF